MTQDQFLLRMTGLLDSAGISYMIAGSYGSGHHGQPRTTNDVDLVIDPTPAQLEAFLSSLGDRYYVSPETARDALRRRFMFNVIDFEEGWKADLIVRKDRPFSVEEFQRRQLATLFGHSLPVASPEDVILTKLEWNRITPSEHQVKDALGIVLVQGANLDRAYMRHWSAALGIADVLEDLFRRVDEPPSGHSP